MTQKQKKKGKTPSFCLHIEYLNLNYSSVNKNPNEPIVVKHNPQTPQQQTQNPTNNLRTLKAKGFNSQISSITTKTQNSTWYYP